MKKRFTLIIIASLLLFHGASPWEGSAAVAPDGELPLTGFYIATNAFPKNTVVDITNIENGRRTRVIVSNTLTGPGLLAVVSREAAELIGMRDGSISRIRMVQPVDPMAYMRFTESMVAGSSENDSGKPIDEEKLVADVYKEDAYKTPDVTEQSHPNIQNFQSVQIAEPPAKPPLRPPVAPGYIVDEPEWGGSGRLQIVDVPGYLVDPIEQPSVTQIPPKVEDKKREIEPPYQVAEIEEKPPKEPAKDVPEFTSEVPRNEVVKDASEWKEKIEVATPERTETEKQPDRPNLTLVETTPNPPPSTVLDMFPDDFISGIASATPEKTDDRVNENTPSTVNPNASIRTIDRLDKGKYYVQVAAPPADLVENMLKQIDRNFSPVVFKSADNMYRILIGPLNQGESAAVLVRFKSIGYKDAFVRIGR